MRALNQFGVRQWTTVALLLLLGVALAFGLYGRFVGIGLWPYGDDEFFIGRSIDHVLRTGLPRYACGGFYTRGLTFQYLVALVRLGGFAPEFSGRLVSAVCSLIGLPAAYLIGRRLHGRALGLMLVIVLSVSVWEIEMARFARMYAPFQSVFVWYVVYFLRYRVDGDRRALVPMVALSVLGVLTWEGGALLGVANLLPPLMNHERGRLRRGDGPYLLGMLLLLGVLFLATHDFSGASPPLPVAAQAAPASAPASAGLVDWGALAHRPGWMLLYLLVPCTLSLWAARWVWSLRTQWLAACGLGLVLVSALLHQFALCGASLAIVLLADLVQPAQFTQRPARPYLPAILACAAFWAAFGLTTHVWNHPPADDASQHAWLGLALQLGGYPDIVGSILRPWGRTVPWLAIGIVLLAITLAVLLTRRKVQHARVISTLLILTLVLILAVGADPPPRIETRYTFFLYPLLIALSLDGLIAAVESWLGSSPETLALGVTLGLLLFGLSEDFQPAHVAKIDSRQVNFRLGLNPLVADQYFLRVEYRRGAQWLREHAHPGELVLVSIPTIDQYYHRANFFFLPQDDPRYEEFACGQPPVDRWTNLPLLYGTDALATKVAAGQRILVVMYPYQVQPMLLEAQRRGWPERLAWESEDGGMAVVAIN